MISAGPLRARSVDEVLDLYREFGGDCYDEAVTQVDHARQCAAHAAADKATPELVVAALLHDVGHLLDLAGRLQSDELCHEQSGTQYLTDLFPAAVTRPIALHVKAKRYLCATETGYLAALSAGSLASLDRQGGAMTAQEVSAFERNPAWCESVQLRRWDDLGKVDGVEVPSMDSYRALLLGIAQS